jgi:hypothetical protein
MNKDTNVMDRLNRSEVYGEYHKAFGEATELPLTLRPLETWHRAHRHQAHENPFCAIMAQANRTCAACLEVQHRAVEGATNGPETVTCFAGLCDTAVPIKLPGREERRRASARPRTDHCELIVLLRFLFCFHGPTTLSIRVY